MIYIIRNMLYREWHKDTCKFTSATGWWGDNMGRRRQPAVWMSTRHIFQKYRINVGGRQGTLSWSKWRHSRYRQTSYLRLRLAMWMRIDHETRNALFSSIQDRLKNESDPLHVISEIRHIISIWTSIILSIFSIKFNSLNSRCVARSHLRLSLFRLDVFPTSGPDCFHQCFFCLLS